MTTQTARFVLNGVRFGVTLETKTVTPEKTQHFKTVNHEPIPADAATLSLTGEYPGGGGQCQDTIREAGANIPAIQRLCDIWDRWHLNDMTAGSATQTQFLSDNPITPADYAHPKSHFEVASQRLTAAGINPDPSGYKYGSAWLFDMVPAEIVAEVSEIMTDLNGARLGKTD